jgi:cytochrome c553
MWPGCHGYEAPAWTYAGTVFISDDGSSPARGVTVTIRDSTGEYRLKTNSAGSFYTSKGDPARGYEASIALGREIRTMNLESAEGACNSCHARDGQTAPLHTD